jgi:hypothetical protein
VPVETPKHSFVNFAEARKWAKGNITGTYKNESTGERIRVSNSAIDKYLSKKAVEKSVSLDAHLSALTKIPELIETFVLSEVHPDRNNDSNIKEIQRLSGAIDYEGNVYPVKITVKSIINEGNKAYSYEVMEIESPVGERGDHIPESADFLPQTTGLSSESKDNTEIEEKQDIGEKIAQAEAGTDTNPTEAQKEAGNSEQETASNVPISQYEDVPMAQSDEKTPSEKDIKNLINDIRSVPDEDIDERDKIITGIYADFYGRFGDIADVYKKFRDDVYRHYQEAYGKYKAQIPEQLKSKESREQLKNIPDKLLSGNIKFFQSDNPDADIAEFVNKDIALALTGDYR